MFMATKPRTTYRWLFTTALLPLLSGSLAHAQDATLPAAALATTPAAAEATPPAPAATATAAEPAPAPPAPALASADPLPAEKPEVTVGVSDAPPAAAPQDVKVMNPPAVWMRLDNKIQNGRDSKKLDDLSNGAEVNLLLSGQVHQFVKWTANFVGTFGTYGNNNITGNASILDLIGQFEFHDAINVWFGRMLVPSDRANFAGPWFMAPWNYPGFYPAPVLGGAPVGPRQGPSGRNDGVTAWGQFGGGVFKYYAGVFDLHDVGLTPLYTGRLNLSLLAPEPGFYHSATYYGKDVLNIGVGAQYQKDGSVQALPPDAPDGTVAATAAYSEINADVLFEKTFGGGVLDVEGAFHLFPGKYDPVKHHWFGLASYLLPFELGIGRLQPLVRLQMAKERAAGDDWLLVDGQIGYVIDKYAARLALGYQHSSVGAVDGNAVFLGIQLQK